MSNLITHLSFTRLKELAHSPLALKQYIEGGKTTTAAMTEGSLLDCLLFTPEDLEKRFLVIEKLSKATKEGKALWAWAEEEASAKDGQPAREIVTTEQLSEAQMLDVCIRQNSTVAFHGLLNPDFFKFQVPVSFKYGGFEHKYNGRIYVCKI